MAISSLRCCFKISPHENWPFFNDESRYFCVIKSLQLLIPSFLKKERKKERHTLYSNENRQIPNYSVTKKRSSKRVDLKLSVSSLEGFFLKASEADVQRCSVKKVFLKIPQNSQKNTCTRVSFLINLQASGLQLY